MAMPASSPTSVSSKRYGSSMKKLFAASIAAIALSYPTMAAAPPFDTPAPVAFMKDLSSGAILYSKNPDQRIPPASLAKMMTVYLAFDMVKQGRVKDRKSTRLNSSH